MGALEIYCFFFPLTFQHRILEQAKQGEIYLKYKTTDALGASFVIRVNIFVQKMLIETIEDWHLSGTCSLKVTDLLDSLGRICRPLLRFRLFTCADVFFSLLFFFVYFFFLCGQSGRTWFTWFKTGFFFNNKRALWNLMAIVQPSKNILNERTCIFYCLDLHRRSLTRTRIEIKAGGYLSGYLTQSININLSISVSLAIYQLVFLILLISIYLSQTVNFYISMYQSI